MESNTTTLPNGLRVITSSRPELETVSLGVWVKTGAACESDEINGISHFLEHMVFKGTKTRNVMDISEQIEDVGGQINAYTSREFTAYYAKMLKDDVRLALDVISDIIKNSVFPEAELLKEQEVVIQEIKQGLDTPDDVIFDHLQAQAFPNQPLGKSILGTEESVRSFTKAKLNKYLQTNYGGDNMVVCAVGKITHEEFVKIVSEFFSDYHPHAKIKTFSQNYQGGAFFEERDIEQAHVVLGFESFTYYSDNYYPSMILSSILGGGATSRLFREVREKRGLVYSVYSYANSHTQSGLLGIYAGTGKDELNQLMPVVCDEIVKICNEPVLDSELHRAKTQMKASILMALESSSSISEILARQTLIYNRIIPISEMIERIEAVNKDNILEIAQKIFVSKPSYALVGAIENHMSYQELEKKLRIS